MKIQKITFENHLVFPKNSEFIFFDESETNIPKVFFIVWDNGGGKTHLLESWFFGLWNQYGSKITNYELSFDLKITENEKLSSDTSEFIHLKIKKIWSSSNWNPRSNICKLYFSSLDINFNIPKIEYVTASWIDNKE